MYVYNEIGPGGVPTLTPPFSNYINVYSLTANTAKTVTWPSGAQFCSITGDGTANYWVNTTTATVGSGDNTTGTGSGINTAQRQKGTEATFSIISASSMYMSVEFWSGNSGF